MQAFCMKCRKKVEIKTRSRSSLRTRGQPLQDSVLSAAPGFSELVRLKEEHG